MPPRPSGRLLALAQLLRLPNVFTVVADGLVAGFYAGLLADPAFWLALAASCCLYLAGMTSNDLFDRADDARDRPSRPLPSGRVSVRLAVTLTALLTAGGIILGIASGGSVGWLAALVAAIYAYNGGLKHTPVGPLVMGGCRLTNLLFLFSLADSFPAAVAWHVAGVVGVYIAGVTWFARTEEARSRPRDLAAAATVILAAVAAVLFLPLHETPPPANRALPYLVTLYGVALAFPLLQAVRDPRPATVQEGVKRAILGLIALDAILASHAISTNALLILLLYFPTKIMSRWVYST